MNDTRGLVFNIVRGSFVDGYGVRTTIFLKGCPLKCDWCCNVEGQSGQPELKVTYADCDGCGRCVPVCPACAIALGREHDGGTLKIDRAVCSDCGECAKVCYTGALDCFGAYYSVEQLLQIIRRDEQYYRASGGGVTIGGGEPTAQAEFTYALIQACKKNFIHVALDTCGYTATDAGFRCLAEADLLLYDIKHMDSARHKERTGVSNELILNNYKKLDAMGRRSIVRIPVIPGFNTDEDNLRATAEFLAERKSLERLDLIGYHNYSTMKYEQLGRCYNMDASPAEESYMQDVKRFFESYGLNTQLGG
jgi:pyruvate formate lyase activating enzyme